MHNDRKHLGDMSMAAGCILFNKPETEVVYRIGDARMDTFPFVHHSRLHTEYPTLSKQIPHRCRSAMNDFFFFLLSLFRREPCILVVRCDELREPVFLGKAHP